jgi:hypothetical protein
MTYGRSCGRRAFSFLPSTIYPGWLLASLHPTQSAFRVPPPRHAPALSALVGTIRERHDTRIAHRQSRSHSRWCCIGNSADSISPLGFGSSPLPPCLFTTLLLGMLFREKSATKQPGFFRHAPYLSPRGIIERKVRHRPAVSILARDGGKCYENTKELLCPT